MNLDKVQEIYEKLIKSIDNHRKEELKRKMKSNMNKDDKRFWDGMAEKNKPTNLFHNGDYGD